MSRSEAPRTIKTTVPVPEVVALFEGDVNMRFICYGVAKILNQKYQFSPSPVSLWNDHPSFAYNEIDVIYGCGALAAQIDKQLFEYLVDLGLQDEKHTHFGFKFGDFYLSHSGDMKHGIQFEELANKFRIQIMKMILAKDPGAVFTIDLANTYHVSMF
jgi:hypothetical protein